MILQSFSLCLGCFFTYQCSTWAQVLSTHTTDNLAKNHLQMGFLGTLLPAASHKDTISSHFFSWINTVYIKMFYANKDIPKELLVENLVYSRWSTKNTCARSGFRSSLDLFQCFKDVTFRPHVCWRKCFRFNSLFPPLPLSFFNSTQYSVMVRYRNR